MSSQRSQMLLSKLDGMSGLSHLLDILLKEQPCALGRHALVERIEPFVVVVDLPLGEHHERVTRLAEELHGGLEGGDVRALTIDGEGAASLHQKALQPLSLEAFTRRHEVKSQPGPVADPEQDVRVGVIRMVGPDQDRVTLPSQSRNTIHPLGRDVSYPELSSQEEDPTHSSEDGSQQRRVLGRPEDIPLLRPEDIHGAPPRVAPRTRSHSKRRGLPPGQLAPRAAAVGSLQAVSVDSLVP
ncbi:MAG: hypothetical protein V3R81_12460, partial [Gammaproteobacteria bacterium]